MLYLSVFSCGSTYNNLASPIDAFVTTLRLRARTCEFGEQEDSLIRDRIVLSCTDARVQERLLCEPGLTLDKALELCRAAETAQQQLRVINSGSGTEQTLFSSVGSAVSGFNQAAGNFVPRQQCGNCGKTTRRVAAQLLARYVAAVEEKITLPLSVAQRTGLQLISSSSLDSVNATNRRYRSQSRSRRQGNQSDRSSVHTVEVSDDQHQYDSLYVGQSA
jgi:hypothetical protein